MKVYYLGLKKETIDNNDFFKKAIVVSGADKNDLGFKDIYDCEINYNDIQNFSKISEFYSMAIEKINKEDKNAKFMLYNQAAIEYMKDTSQLICINDIKLIKQLNNKPLCRNLLGQVINLLDYKYLEGKDISYDKIIEIFDNKYRRYVIQQPVGFGGVGTFLMDESNAKSIVEKLDKNTIYSISGYVENSSTVNNTFIVSKKDILIFDGSYQIIKINGELFYNGWDFEKYSKMDSELKIKIFNQTMNIAKRMQSLGYLGICGVDYLIDHDNVYFMEINPRFQASSKELDKKLIQKKLPGVFELNYMCFYSQAKFKKYCIKIGGRQ